ncbi:ribonuclease H-like domain-containing protein [Tanacetum coccineum]
MGPIHNNTLNELLSKLLQQLGNLNVSGSSTSHGSTSHGPSGVPVAYHSGPYGLDVTNVQPTQPDSSCHMDTAGQATVLPYAFTMGTLHNAASGAWNFDTGVSSHLNNSVNSLSEIFNTCMYLSVSVGDGHSIPVTNTGHSILPTPTRSLHLNNVLITPHIVKNLISVRQFVCDNNYTIEFDAFGFFVKDFLTRRVLLRCDITGDLYQATTPSHIPYAFLVSQHMWHQRLGHPGGEVLRRLVSSNFISYNKEKPPVLCHACQLGKHVRLSFVSSNTMISSCFDNIHSDVWTSPIPSLSGFKYYTVLSLADSQHWPIHQLDVKNAFLHGDLSETVYMHQPLGFWDYVHPDYVCLLQRQGNDTAYLLLYVDDIVLTASSESIPVTRDSSGLFLSQKKYAIEILEKAHMVSCNPSRTPVDTESKLGVDGDPVSDPTLYRSLAGSLQYLTFTRPNISYAVQQVCLHMHDPWEPHLSALKRILRYVQGTLNYGLQLFSSSTTNLVAYSDADWAGCPTTRRLTSGYCVFLGNNLLSWSAKRRAMLSRSNTEAECRGVANAVAKTCWLRNLLRELHTPLSSATLVYCDNISAVYLSSNPVQHQRTKHIEIDIHFIRDLVVAGQVRVLHIPSRYKFADIFTKGLPSALFEEFRTSLSIWCPPAPTVREC